MESDWGVIFQNLKKKCLELPEMARKCIGKTDE
jgi:hypothetical protein